MLRAIFYKEWLKTRWYYLVAVLLSLGFVGYVLLNFFRAAGLKGIAHLWEVMLLRDAVFVDLLQFVPLVVGLLFAVVQFVPEMQRKCLKLTLHLPCPELRMIGAMLLYGVLLLGALFAVSLGVLFVAFRAVLAPELPRRSIFLSNWSVKRMLDLILPVPKHIQHGKDLIAAYAKAKGINFAEINKPDNMLFWRISAFY